jgi:hypothetical protein
MMQDTRCRMHDEGCRTFTFWMVDLGPGEIEVKIISRGEIAERAVRGRECQCKNHS